MGSARRKEHLCRILLRSAIDAGTADALREINTSAGTLRYYDVGNGPTVLFLHGSGPGVTGWRNFRGVLPTFAERFRCLVLEFPGFGVSGGLGRAPPWSPHRAP